jgi:hypothetical protein
MKRRWSSGRRLVTLAAAAAVSLTAAGAARAASGPPTGFLVTPTEELGVPGRIASGEITPEGDIYTGWAEYEPFAGPGLRPWRQPTRVAPNPGEPLYLARLRRGAIAYAERVFTVAVGRRPVVYLTLSAHNRDRRPRTASVALQLEYTRGVQVPTFDGIDSSRYRYPRPAPERGGPGSYVELGARFDPSWVYAVSGRDVTRDGELLLRGPRGSARSLPTSGDAITSPHAKRAYSVRLAAGGEARWTWQIPLDPPAAGPAADAALDAEPLRAAQAAFTALWKRQDAGAMRIELPEPRVADVFRESLTNILQARYRSPSGWVQAVNKFQYQAFWLRDSAIMTVALDEAGLHAAAGQNLGFLPFWQEPDGLYISQPGEYDGIGQALWEMAEHALLAGDPAYASAVLDRVGAAVSWIAEQSAADPDGLLPPSSTNDDEQMTNARITGDEIWAAVGLRSAISLARLAGRLDLVHAWRAVDRRFEASLDAALAADETANGHITPALDVPGGIDWGNYLLDYPMEIVAPDSVEVTSTIAWERARSDQGLPGYGCRVCLHDYMGFPIFQAELDRGGGSVAGAIAGLYAETAHTTSTGAGWEDGPVGTHRRVTVDNLAPHGTFAGQYVALVHNLLVDDRGGRVRLLAGVSPAWMAPGNRIAVARAATGDGPVSLALRVKRRGATLRWSLRRFRGRTEPLVWTLPYWVHAARTPTGRRVHGSVALRGDRGRLTLRWSARRPRQSLRRAILRLDRVYTRAGKRAPLRPAAGGELGKAVARLDHPRIAGYRSHATGVASTPWTTARLAPPERGSRRSASER